RRARTCSPISTSPRARRAASAARPKRPSPTAVIDPHPRARPRLRPRARRPAARAVVAIAHAAGSASARRSRATSPPRWRSRLRPRQATRRTPATASARTTAQARSTTTATRRPAGVADVVRPVRRAARPPDARCAGSRHPFPRTDARSPRHHAIIASIGRVSRDRTLRCSALLTRSVYGLWVQPRGHHLDLPLVVLLHRLPDGAVLDPDGSVPRPCAQRLVEGRLD